MFGQGTTQPTATKPTLVDMIDAKIRGRVGEFLQLKSSLIDLSQSSNPQVVKRALDLLNTQSQLETTLSWATSTIDQVKSGSLSLFEMGVAGLKLNSFVNDVESQIRNVHQLQDQAKSGGAIPQVTGFGFSNLILPVAVVAGVLVVGSFVFSGFKRKRSATA